MMIPDNFIKNTNTLPNLFHSPNTRYVLVGIVLVGSMICSIVLIAKCIFRRFANPIVAHRPLSTIRNTQLTDMLVPHAFNQVQDDTKVNNLYLHLQTVCKRARDGFADSQELLTHPNNHGETIDQGLGITGGFPRNTPLMLLVKAGKNYVEHTKLILPFYSKQDLLFTTPRGNTVLHVAVATGQLETAMLILKRAEELEVLNELLTAINFKNLNADTILKALLDSGSSFKNAKDQVYDQLGEEVQKANVLNDNPKIFILRPPLIDCIKNRFDNHDMNIRDIRKLSLLQIYRCTIGNLS